MHTGGEDTGIHSALLDVVLERLGTTLGGNFLQLGLCNIGLAKREWCMLV